MRKAESHRVSSSPQLKYHTQAAILKPVSPVWASTPIVLCRRWIRRPHNEQNKNMIQAGKGELYLCLYRHRTLQGGPSCSFLKLKIQGELTQGAAKKDQLLSGLYLTQRSTYRAPVELIRKTAKFPFMNGIMQSKLWPPYRSSVQFSSIYSETSPRRPKKRSKTATIYGATDNKIQRKRQNV